MRQVGVPRIVVAFVVTVVAACGGRSSLEDPSPDGGEGGASEDAAFDGASPDGGFDSSFDALPDAPASDAGLETSVDASPEGSTDASPEGSVEGGVDAAPDAPPVLTAPRPLAPLSTSTVTSQRPTLRWELDPGSDGAQIEICRDRPCTTLVASFSAGGTRARPPSALSAGVYFWRLHGTASGVVRPGVSPTWEMVVGHGSATVDTSWGSIPDVDGDGLTDGFTASISDNGPGVAFSYRGNANGLTPWSAFGSPASTPAGFFGVELASAGDVDGDGFPELLVGDSYRMWIYPGGPAGVALTPTLIFPDTGLITAATTLGDVDGDGYADVAIGVATNTTDEVEIYRGGPNGLSAPTPIPIPGSAQTSDPIGADVNGDGYGDLVIEAADGVPFGGQVLFFAGGPTGLASTPVVAYDAAHQQTFVKLAGDVNGDGYADFADLAPDPSMPDASAIYVGRIFPGGPSGIGAPIVFATPDRADVATSGTIFTVGDVDADGRADVGIAILAGGGPAGVWVYTHVTSLGLDTYGEDGFSNPGSSTTMTMFSAAGDVNGDGYDDVLGGDWQVTHSSYLFLGSNNGLTLAPSNFGSILEGGDSVL